MANAEDLSIRVTVDASPALGDVERLRKALVAIQPVSPRLSFKGWLLSVWLAKNKGYIKKVLAPVSAVVTAGTIEPAILRYVGIALGLGLLTLVSKLGWDAFDYFVSDVPLEPKP